MQNPDRARHDARLLASLIERARRMARRAALSGDGARFAYLVDVAEELRDERQRLGLLEVQSEVA